ncbi:Rne/Rng family ribonuclease [Candidatus Deianiraea vastatrix]|uniref:Ribonuclease E n=1 Tax=Candidatus Deianiraea vastatrix TaxID=2163644 RepID=A0A5B8XGF3_9RICK|nr:Rne/Rng family ribonuclease [Candidatus Deianiraea vastatrix]QED23384.1 Ribonuclease E [Candidatus Deianiraea vastatrix]
MEKVVISGSLSSYKIVILDKNDAINDVIFGGSSSKSIKSNIYLAKVTRVEPSLQAAFVEYGEEKSGFLPFSEIHSDYHNNTKTLNEILHGFYTKQAEASKESEDKLNEQDEGIDDLTAIDKIEFSLDESENKQSEMFTEDEKKDKKRIFIQDVIKTGQYLLVQVFRDERGNKGASVTTYITFPTKYCVFTPNNRRLHGVSKRIPDQQERQRLRNAIDTFGINGDFGLVVRTAACDASVQDLKKDYDLAVEHWHQVIEKTKIMKVGLISEAESGIIQSIRDVTTKEAKVVTDSEEIANLVLSLSDKMNIKKEHMMIHRSKDVTLFDKFGITEKLNDLYKDRVNLPSGGYLIINYTEALVAIDVNSGRLVNEKDVENTALKTNLEAVSEIANQLRLRDIGGLIVVDFIDMEEVSNRKKIELKMKDVISLKDRARVQFTAISHFGLMEISRQRLRTGFMESSTLKCNHCNGTGRSFMPEMTLDELYQCLEFEIFKKKYTKFEVKTSFQVESRFASYNKQKISELCKQNGIEFTIIGDPEMKLDSFIMKGLDKESNAFVDVTKFNGLSKIDDLHGGVNGWVGKRDRFEPNAKRNNKQSSRKSQTKIGLVVSSLLKVASIFKSKKKEDKFSKKNKKNYNPRSKTYDNKFSGKKHYNGRRKR